MTQDAKETSSQAEGDERPPSTPLNTRLLIDLLTQNFAEMLARLVVLDPSRPSLAHVEDLLFASLAKALRNQSWTTPVIADLLGFANPSSYRKRIRRVGERAGAQTPSLRQQVLGHLAGRSLTRPELFHHFRTRDARSLRGVLKELVDSGLVVAEGEPLSYRLRQSDFGGANRGEQRELVAVVISQRGPLPQDQLAALCGIDAEALGSIVEELLAEGRAFRDEEGALCGSPATFELSQPRQVDDAVAALLHHYGWVSTALVEVGQKWSRSENGSTPTERPAVLTCTLDSWENHPSESSIDAVHQSIMHALRDLFDEHAQAEQDPDAPRNEITLYFGIVEKPSR